MNLEMNLDPRAEQGSVARYGEPRSNELAEILDGLALTHKRLPTRLLYDQQGSRWFEAICDLPEYYLTRIETEILRTHADAIADFAGPGAAVIEPGAGSGDKTRILLRTLQAPALYAPLDIDPAALRRCEIATRRAFPGLRIVPVQGDFQQDFKVPTSGVRRALIFFPGSTIGNFEPLAAARLLRRFRTAAGDDGRLLIGIDLRKNAAALRRAYDDAAGVTAAFNLNLLKRLNREYDAQIEVSGFEHRAIYDKQRHRIEMHLVSRRIQTLRIGGRSIRLRSGEIIHTENSYKFLPSQFARLAATAGWTWSALWMDPSRQVAVLGFRG